MGIPALSMVIDAILEMGVDATWGKVKRREAVIELLRRFKLDPTDPPTDFDTIYMYTLLEYGVFKPEPILKFFRNEFVREAFRESFYRNDPPILQKEAEGIIQWNEETGKLGRIDYDPRREFAAFTAVFNEIVDRSRMPAEVKRDRRLDRIYHDLQRGLEEISERLEGLPLDEIRGVLVGLVQRHEARRFVVAPTGEKLKVFVSSTMMELRDVRELVAKSLHDRGIKAWVYEAHARAAPETVVGTSLREVEAADIYVGLFWQQRGEVTVQEYHHARALGRPCLIYIRDKDIEREKALDDFLSAEVYDLHLGVTYSYFDSAVEVGQQVAEDTMAWLVRRHREMTAEIREARVSRDEIARLQEEVARLQAASRERLPQGTDIDYLARQMRAWFDTLGYGVEYHDVRTNDYFEWIVSVPARRGYDRVLVRGIAGEAEMSNVTSLRRSVDEQRTDEGWLVAVRRVSQAARDEVEKRENRDLFCYTFDELLDEDADLSGYFDWLEAEVERLGIDTMYVPLACIKEEFDPVTKRKVGESRYNEQNGWLDGYVDRWLDDPSREHISILGEFGTGKTWFALHYAWISLQRYRDAKERGIERPRAPLVIPLRDYAKAVSVESLFSEFFFRKHEIPLPGYSAFEQLNRMGKLLLIFDGFDEMAAKVDRQEMINNFWELARVVVPGSKVILTCRTEHFPEAQEGRALLSAELQASTAKLTGEPPQFEVLELEKFSADQIRQVLSFRASTTTVNQVMANPKLLDLARRPIMTQLVLDALPDIDAGKPVDLSRVYLYAVQRKMERDIRAERTFTSLADKLYFLCELSWEMLSEDKMSLNYRHFPERIRRLFGPLVQEQTDLDHWHYDMMGQTLLIRNADGDYMPAHRSLVEFFVAYKLAAELGILAADFTALSQAQSNLDQSAMPLDYTWSAYFQREMDEEGIAKPIAPLHGFIREPMERLISTVGLEPLPQAVLVLMESMIVPEELWGCVEATRGLRDVEVCYTGGNATTLLGRAHEDFKGANLADTVLIGGDLFNADLTGVNLRGAILRESKLSNCVLQAADLRDADLTDIQIDEMQAIWSVAWDPGGQYLATGGEDAILRVWNLAEEEGKPYVFRGHSQCIWSISWSDEGRLRSWSGDDSIITWDLSSPERLIRETFGQSYSNPRPAVDSDQTASRVPIRAVPSPSSTQLPLESFDPPAHSAERARYFFARNYTAHHELRGEIRESMPKVVSARSQGTRKTPARLSARFGSSPSTRPSAQSWLWQISTHPVDDIVAIGSYSATVEIRDSASGECLRTIEQKLDCQNLQLAGAVGLDAVAPDGKGTLQGWLAQRGAILTGG